MAKNASTRATRKKEESDRIIFIERRPQAQWFSQETDQAGRRGWFLHMEITGLLERKFGPFVSKRKALLFCDHLLDNVLDGVNEATHSLSDYQLPAREFASHIFQYPVVGAHVSPPSPR